ncbi:DNA-binding MurR/RpiR family transcriptional regulator [Rhizobium sp. BK529]|uniref:MurR/RpiR family transcriptional regulator n=1 Tax=unclassified Rhizobium TaxID=2613769 RepID=UPI0014048C0A|nr:MULTISPECIES: MurR/RpiR family transcriptional regulator [unclassified Rhizobium]MBB3595306.1 DNA-binding MurR/RpiR family transcriptional regulator [Rhizobium sp. BK529]
MRWRGLQPSGPDIFAFESSHKIAERCNVSQASVIRFAHHLGFDGFAELKQIFQQGLRAGAQK